MGKYGYSSIGAVVGATYPAQAAELRKLMPKCFFLVPGYGAQGGGAEDALPCFNPDGLGAIVNSSRGILYSHMSDGERMECTRGEYLAEVKKAVLNMRQNLYTCLRAQYPAMCY
jgi:orotidine-5'-phosphate decarboxylase